MIDTAKLDALDPLLRLEFDKVPVCIWKVTWPDGTSETVQAHSMYLNHEAGTAAFHYQYLGAHRIINLTHVRDIATVPKD